jgi:hypothetical protein
MVAGVRHDPVVYVEPSPLPPTATQNRAEAHEIPFTGLTAIVADVVHVLPLKLIVKPASSTAAQNTGVGHETASEFPLPSI